MTPDTGTPQHPVIGLIAGGGQFPLLFARAARRCGFKVYATAHIKETDPALAGEVDAIEWIHLGQIGRLIRFFKTRGVQGAVMVGTIAKTRMFKDVRPDMKAIRLMAALRHTHDDNILRNVAALLEREGVHIRPSTELLPELLAPPGCWTRRKPEPDEMEDIRLGRHVAEALGRLDIGQSVVVGGGTVLAVEALEGTDAAIRRGGGLGNGRVVVVKVCKPIQDFRFDVPAVGADTVEVMRAAGADFLAVEAGRALVFDREEMVRLADRWEIGILAFETEKDDIP